MTLALIYSCVSVPNSCIKNLSTILEGHLMKGVASKVQRGPGHILLCCIQLLCPRATVKGYFFIPCHLVTTVCRGCGRGLALVLCQLETYCVSDHLGHPFMLCLLET